jgi:hypothetical protein
MRVGLLSEVVIPESQEVNPQAVDLGDVNAGMLDIEVAVSEGGEIQMQIETAEAAADTLEEVAQPLEKAQEAGEEVSEAAMEALNVSIKHILGSMGARVDKVISTESFGVGKNKRVGLESAIETIKTWVKKIIASIVNGFKRLIQWLKDTWAKLFNTEARLDKAVDALIKKIDANPKHVVKEGKEWVASSFLHVLPGINSPVNAKRDYKLSEVISKFPSFVDHGDKELAKQVKDIEKLAKLAGSVKLKQSNAAIEEFKGLQKNTAGHVQLANTFFMVDTELSNSGIMNTTIEVVDAKIDSGSTIVNDKVQISAFRPVLQSVKNGLKSGAENKKSTEEIMKALDGLVKATESASKEIDGLKEEDRGTEENKQIRENVTAMNSMSSELRKITSRLLVTGQKVQIQGFVSMVSLASSSIGSAGEEKKAA